MREQFGPGAQGREKIPFALFILIQVIHALSSHGSLGFHARNMTGEKISGAALCQRRAGLGWGFFKAIFQKVLGPIAKPETHKESFYAGMRLVAVDSTWWSLRNSAANAAANGPRHGNGKGRETCAFFKWQTSVLLEVGTHQPLMAACAKMGGGAGEGEFSLARRLCADIPRSEPVLLLADRYYGKGAFFAEVRREAGPGCHLLVRVGANLKSRVVGVSGDGSAIVSVTVAHPKIKRLKTSLKLREIRGVVHRGETGGPPWAIRLWTTLLDEAEHPASVLLELYTQRWEQELFFRELKRNIPREQLLRAGTPGGAEAEFGAMVLAAGVLAGQRLKAAEAVGLPPCRISLTLMGLGLDALVLVLSLGGDVLDARTRKMLVARFLERLAKQAVIPPRRRRGCQRGLRKPVSAWPRVKSRQDVHGEYVYDPIRMTFP